MNEQIVIDPVNLAGYLLIRWKKIILGAFAIAIITFVVGAVIKASRPEPTDAANNAEANTEESAVDIDAEIAAAAAVLTDEQKADGDLIYSRILEYEKYVEEQRNTITGSYLLSLDPDTAVGFYMQYLLETDVGNANMYYNTYILSEDDYRAIDDALGPDIGRSFLNEAVSISTSNDAAEPSYIMDLERSTRLAGEIDNKYKQIVSIYIYAPDKETCNKIAEITDAAVKRRTKLLNEQGAIAKCSLIDEGYTTNAQLNITNSKRDKTNTIVGLTNGEPGYINNMLALVDPREETYVDRLRGIMPQEDKNESEEEPGPKKTKITWKSVLVYSLIALFGGVFLSAAWFALLYVIDGKIHSQAELSAHYNIPVLRKMSANMSDGDVKKTDIITKWGLYLSEAGTTGLDCLNILTEELSDKIDREGVKQLYIATDRSSVVASEISHRLSERSLTGVKYIEGSIDPDANDMKPFLASDCVVLLPVFNRTKRKSIRAFLDICRRNSKCLIGFVPVTDRDAL